MSGGDVRRGRATSFSEPTEAVEMEIVYRRRAFLREIYQKIAVRYVFMAEELLRRPERDVEAVESGPV
jgi:hypothetical protein